VKKILFFETKEFTGATRVTRTLAKAARKNYEVAFAQVGDNTCEDIESAIRKECPDILFSGFISINPDVIKIGKDRGLYVIIRNDYNLNDVSEVLKARAIALYPYADKLIVQTAEMRQEILRSISVDYNKVKVRENPVDEDDILEKSKAPNPFPNNGKYHYLWVGRNDPIKDLSTLKKAFEIVNSQYPETDLTLVSNDPNPYRWMKHANCMVISSISEASPNVLFEALFLGIKIVSTDCSPTIRKYLSKEWVCPVKDVIALSRIMSNAYKSRL